MDEELKLLRHNLVTLGWVQPILATPAGVIVDGYHRWKLAQLPEVVKVCGELVPVAYLDLSADQLRAVTVRMNRAKGNHAATRMANLVVDLVDVHGWTLERVARELGASKTETQRLYENSIFTTKGLKDYRYGQAWVPVEGPSRRRRR